MRYILAACLALCQALTGHAQTTTDVNGTWTAELRDAKVFLQVRTAPPAEWNGDRWGGDWSTGQTLTVDEFPGLPVGDAHLTVEQIKFELHREAGSLAFQGAFRDGRGAGLFTFAPRAQFTAEMKAIGYADDLPLWRRFQLALHDVGPKYIRAMKAEGYDRLTLDQVQRAKTHGVSIEYVKAMKAEGYTVAAIEDIVRTRDHGVTPDYVKAMRGAGFRDVPLADLVRARDHGVSAEYIADMKGLGLKELTLEQIVRLRDHGITPGFVNHVRAQGYKENTAEGLIELKNHGTWRR